MTRYLVAVGGSGQHVALAVADYLALAQAVFEKPLPPIHFFLLDSDPAATKTDESSAWDLCLEQLTTIHSADPTRVPQTKHDHPYPELPTGIETARQALIALLGPSAAGLLLSPAEAEVRIREGYFGKPHIAGILTEVLLRRVEAQQVAPEHVIRQLVTALQVDSRICLAGSTVGGTGAGVLPRLVEYLAGKNERAKICANVGLEWFQINPDHGRGVARQVQMPPNATASLWHFVRERTLERYRLVLWGHPAIGQATQEPDSGDRFQPVKHNLTLPIHASAAAIAFLFGDETQTREVVPVIDDDHVGLSRTLDFGSHDLNWLIERNRDLLGRLAFLKSYIQGPYRGAVVPWLRDGCCVKVIDKMSAEEKNRLVATIDALTRAKERALRRLGDSDEKLGIAAPISRRGIATLRDYVKSGVTVEAITKTLTDVDATKRDDSAIRLIRSSAMNRQPFPAAPVGTRQPLETGHIDAVAQFDSVEAERVPDIRASERVLTQFFSHAARGDLTRMDLMVNRFHEILVPQQLQTMDGDRVHHWVHRWLFLLHAVVTGVASTRTLDRPVEGITDAIYIGDGAEPIGYLSPKLLVVPNFAPFWSNDTEMQSVSSRAGTSATLATWIQIIRSAAFCAGTNQMPEWMTFLVEIFGSDRRRSRLRASGNTLPIALDTVRNIPLPAESGSDLLVDAICEALDLRLQDLQEADKNFSEPEREVWNDLNERRVRYRPITSPNDATWTPITADAEIIWGDLLSDATSRYRFDDVVLYPNRTYGWRRRTLARFLTPADVILDQIAVLLAADGTRSATIPVRSEYSRLVVESEQSVSNDGSVHVDVTLAGRKEHYERRYSHDDVIELNRLTILAWPAMSSVGSASQTLLVADNSDVHYQARIAYADAEETTILSPILVNRDYPHYLTPGEHGVTAAMKPVVLTLHARLPERSSWIDLGFLRFNRENGPNLSESETWAVDFGTSSTVIVRNPVGGAPLIIHAREDRDATSVYACAASIPRKKMRWYHTWDEKRAASTHSNVVPSQLINIAAMRGETPRPSDMIFGRDFMIDHGEEFENAIQQNVIDNLKWQPDAKNRTDYLTHLLEQAVVMEIARTKREQKVFPTELRIVFTLPLRQHSGVTSFATEMNGVATTLKKRTGVVVTPRYQWESLAVAPPELGAGQMIVVADLGGGTLDMYARFEPDEGDRQEAADSARIGGRYCFAMVGNKLGSDLNVHRTFLRASGAPGRDDLASREPRVFEYFNLIHRYIILWTAALRKKWVVPEAIPTSIQLAGMTWSLPGAPTSQANVADILSRQALSLGHKIDFVPFAQDHNAVGSEERKVFLARSAAAYKSYDMAGLLAIAERLEFVIGIPAKGGTTGYPETEDLKKVHPPNLTLTVALEEARKLYPNASNVMLAELTFRLKTSMDARGVGPGGYDTPNRRFGLSPLTVLAELAVEQIAPEGRG